MLMFVRADVCVCNICLYTQFHNTSFCNKDAPTLLFNYMLGPKWLSKFAFLSTTNAYKPKAGYVIHIHNTKFIRTMHTCLCLCARMYVYATYAYMRSFEIQALAIRTHQLCCSITSLHQNGFPNLLFDYTKCL